MRLLCGTSGYSYAPWKGTFYPEKIPTAEMLACYARQLPTVEINNTFYRMPKADVIGRWAEQTPAGFSFAIKAPRRITHDQRLADTEDAVRYLFTAAASLGNKLGPVLFQLPPFLRKDLPRLEAFLALLRELAPQARAAFEFRHESWFVDEVFAALQAGRAALCVSESEELAAPFQSTTSWGYLRLRRRDYDDAALAAWADRIMTQAWSETYVFFKHEDEGRAPALAKQLSSLCV